MKIKKGKAVSTAIIQSPDVELYDMMQMDELDNRGRQVKLHGLLLEKKRRLARNSLYYFCKYVIGFRDMELQPHWELCQFLQTWGHRADCLVLLPRATFKSSIASVGYPIWRWLQNPDLRFLLSSAELANTKGFLGLISQNLKLSSDFRELFGNWDENGGQTWHSTALSIAGRTKLKAENSLTASSIDVSKVSQHYDAGIFDDLQVEKNATSKEFIDKIEGYIQLMLPIIDPQPGQSGESEKGPKLLVGTRWHFDDIYGRLIAAEKKRRREGKGPKLRMLIREAFTKKAGKPKVYYFPTRFNDAYLDDIAESMTRYRFSCNYLNNPLPDEDQVFSPKYVNYFQVQPDGSGKVKERIAAGVPDHPELTKMQVRELPRELNFFSLLDPSVGNNADSDFFAFDTLAVDPHFNMYVWDVRRKRFAGDTALALEEMFTIHSLYKPIRMGVESIAFQKYLLWSFKDACRTRGQYLPIQELATDNQITKDMRIKGFQPYWKARRIYLRVGPGVDLDKTPMEELRFHLMEDQDVLLDEAERFPVGTTKDCLDALAYAPQLIFPAAETTTPDISPGTYAWLEREMDRGSRSTKLRAY
jgi:hypothetical protein